MSSPNFLILYVNAPQTSGEFYRRLLQREPIESSPTFVLFALEQGLMLGLWSRHTVTPSATAAGGGGELTFTLEDQQAVDQQYAQWVEQGLTILQTPTRMDFGYTFVALDPDGHRLRVYTPEEA